MAKGGKREGAGRPKGAVAKSTLKARKAKEALIEAYLENIKPINEALIKKAKEGDMQAIKEIHDRIWGKSLQPNEHDLSPELKLLFDEAFKK